MDNDSVFNTNKNCEKISFGYETGDQGFLQLKHYTSDRFDQVLKGIMVDSNAVEFKMTLTNITSGMMEIPSDLKLILFAKIQNDTVSVFIEGYDEYARVVAQAYVDHSDDPSFSTDGLVDAFTDPTSSKYEQFNNLVKILFWKALPDTCYEFLTS